MNIIWIGFKHFKNDRGIASVSVFHYARWVEIEVCPSSEVVKGNTGVQVDNPIEMVLCWNAFYKFTKTQSLPTLNPPSALDAWLDIPILLLDYYNVFLGWNWLKSYSVDVFVLQVTFQPRTSFYILFILSNICIFYSVFS